MRQECYRINAPMVVAERVDDEVILINLESGHYYTLVDAGAVIWTALANGGTASDAIAHVSDRYSGEASAIEDGVSSLIAELTAESLIVPVAGDDTHNGGGAGSPSGPDLHSAPNGTPRPFVAPRVEKYIDMQNLLALDPVLEVDESGWPRPDRK